MNLCTNARARYSPPWLTKNRRTQVKRWVHGRHPSTPNTLLEAVNYFSDLDRATQYVASIRWPEGFVCPSCGETPHYYLKTRRIWKCKACGKQTSVKAGTVFQDSPIPLTKWLPTLWLLVTCKNGISSYEVARGIGVSQKAAWFMLQRLRLALQEGSIEKYSDKFGGVVEVDETYIGGKARKMNAGRRRRLEAEHGTLKGHTGKTPVMGFYERGGKVRLTVIDGTTKPYLHKQVRRHVRPEAEVVTDALPSYEGLDGHYVQKVIDHAEKYAEGLVHTNGIENFWSLLKRGLSGTYVSVRPFHLFRYLDEQAYRYNYRGEPDSEKFELALGRAPGRRVTWDELTSKAPKTDPAPPPPPIAGRRRVLPQRPFRDLRDL